MKSKEELRKLLKDRKCDTTGAASVRIIGQLITMLKSNNVQYVLVYQAIGKWGEIDISSLPGLLSDIQFETIKNTKNVPFPDKKFDVIVIPLLGFNKDGYRLGYGGGWYDKFLKTQPRALKIGVGYEDTLVYFEAEAHDVRMDTILTEKRVRHFRADA